MKKSIVFIITGLNMGGAEMQVFQLAKELKMRQWDINIISMIPPKHFVAELTEIGVSVKSLSMKRGVPSISALLGGLRLINRISPSVVHSHMYHANIFARFLRIISLKKIYLVSTAHNIDETEGSFFRYWLYRLTKNISHINTNVSQIALDHYKKIKLIDVNRGIYIPNGINIPNNSTQEYYISKLFPELQSKFIWLAAGRLVPAKDYNNLILAVEKLSNSTLDFCVLIAGEGPLEQSLQNEITNRKLNSYIKLIGLRHDIQNLMIDADAVVMSSAWEGLPMILLEALAHGKSIVATDVGGISEIIGTHSGGELVPKSSPNELATAMTKIMIESQNSLTIRSQLAKKTAAQFDINTIVSNWEKIYMTPNIY